MSRWAQLRRMDRPKPELGPVCPLSVAAEQDWPRLKVWAAYAGARWWCWRVSGPGGDWLDSGTAATHAQALAVGLAALETASIRS